MKKREKIVFLQLENLLLYTRASCPFTHHPYGADAVVLMCGVNDAKRCLAGRTAAAFHDELEHLVREIRVIMVRFLRTLGL